MLEESLDDRHLDTSRTIGTSIIVISTGLPVGIGWLNDRWEV